MSVRQSRTYFKRVKKQKFGEILLTHGLVTQEQLNEALQTQRKEGGLLGEILINKGYITENEVLRLISTQYGLPVLRLNCYDIDEGLVGRFEPDFLYLNLVLPLSKIGNLILVAACDLPEEEVVEKIEKTGEGEAVFYVASKTDILTRLREIVPISDDQADRFASIRRKPKKGDQTKSDQEETAHSEVLFGELDRAWESIFDEAERNLKQQGI